MCVCTRRTNAAAASAASVSPYVVASTKLVVRSSRPHGSSRKALCWSTAAMARGSSPCTSRARSPPTSITGSAWMRHTTLSGPKIPASPVIVLRSELIHGDRAHDVAALRLERDVHAGRRHVAEEVVALREIARAVGGGDEELGAIGVGTRVGHR